MEAPSAHSPPYDTITQTTQKEGESPERLAEALLRPPTPEDRHRRLCPWKRPVKFQLC